MKLSFTYIHKHMNTHMNTYLGMGIEMHMAIIWMYPVSFELVVTWIFPNIPRTASLQTFHFPNRVEAMHRIGLDSIRGGEERRGEGPTKEGEGDVVFMECLRSVYGVLMECLWDLR